MKLEMNQKGFTLVELAVVMIIIGLLIGGILKGQELLTNAHVASTITQMRGIDAAINTFRDSYAALPGDMRDAQTRLPNCTAATNCQDGGGGGTAGNGRIDQLPGVANTVAGNENVQLWRHLSAADLIGGVDDSGDVTSFGAALPAGNIGGGFTIGFHVGGAGLNGQASGPNPRQGHYLALTGVPDANVGGAATSVIDASQAARIDRKLDDGSPETGSVIGAQEGGLTACINGGIYDEASNPDSCAIYFRVQQ